MILKYMENSFYLCKEEGLQFTWPSEHFDLLVSFFSSPFWSDLLLVISEVMNTIQTHDFVFLWLKILWWLFSFSPRNIFTTREEFYRERQSLIASYLPFSLTRKHREKTQNKAEIKPLIQNEIRFNQLVCLPLVSYKSISLPNAY